jgi:tRNA(Ser,Leu) C12 N-acetylase TAN1
VSWNVLATSLEGRRDALLAALRRLAPFRPAGFRNVLVARVDDPLALLGRLQEAWDGGPGLRTALARVVPVAARTAIEPDTAADTLAAAAEPLLDRLAGGSFFVRLERRGLKGRLHTPTVERALGERVWRALEARGAVPRIDFADPDAVLLVETLGDQAGIAVIDRALRRAHPFVRVR